MLYGIWMATINESVGEWSSMEGGIDCFLRLITFLQCSDNNHSETVLDCFDKATQVYGNPSRVCTGAIWNK